MSEAALWRTVKAGMRNRWHATRHEDALSAGVADISYGCGGRAGWIEMKIARRPKNATTPVRPRHYTPAQKRWLHDRWRAAPRSTWLLIRIDRGMVRGKRFSSFLLLPGREATLLGRAPLALLEGNAERVWAGRIDWSDFAAVLAAPGRFES